MKRTVALSVLALCFLTMAPLPPASAQTDAVATRVRFFPRPGFAERMRGGKFQGSNVGPTSGFVDLATVVAAPADGTWTEMKLVNATAYRFLRYYAPAGSSGNVAEVEFYHDGAKLSGKPFGTFGSRDNGGSTFEKAFDGNTATFFDAPLADDQYAGIEIAAVKGEGGGPAAPAATGDGRRHYHIGNSLTDTIGEYTQAIAKSAGFDGDFFARQTIPGTPLRGNWEAAKGFGTPYPEAFVKYAPLDDLVMQVFIQNGDSADATYSMKFYDLAKQNSPKVRPWIYGQWYGIGGDDPKAVTGEFWEAQTRSYMQVYVVHALNLNRERPEAGARVIPGGLALINLKRAVESGKVPGMPGFFAGNFDDGLHLNSNGRYFIGLVHYAALYGRSPVGLPVVGIGKNPPPLTPEQAKVYQQIAWDTVREFERSPGIVAVPLPAEIDARGYAGALPPFRSQADVRWMNEGAGYDYLVDAPKAGAYELRVSVGNGGKTEQPLEVIVNGEPARTVLAPPTGAESAFGDTPPLTVNLPAGANHIRLRVPKNRPYFLNSLKIVPAGGSLSNTLPTTGFYAWIVETKPGVPYTNLFNVSDAETPADKIEVTAVSENTEILPQANVRVEAGEFKNQWGGTFNRRLTITPADGKIGEAQVTLTIKDAGPKGASGKEADRLSRSIRFTFKVKE